MSRELRLMSIPEIMNMAQGSVDFQGMRGELNWWTIFSGKVSHSHFDAIVDEIQANGFGMPIVLCDREDGRGYVIGNGHHRLCAAILLGLWRIPVMVSNGPDRDDFMCEADSMDDWNKPIYGSSYEYWGMLRDNMEDEFDNMDENESGGEFYCDNCDHHFRNSDDCCLTCHNEGYHRAKCVDCEYDVSECICAIVRPEDDDYRYIYCVDCASYSYAMNHRHCAIPYVWDDAHSEDWQWQADHARMVEVGAIQELLEPADKLATWELELLGCNDIPQGMWHPIAILDEAYAEHDEWLKDEPRRNARKVWENEIEMMREAVKANASIHVLTYWAGCVERAFDAYNAL